MNQELLNSISKKMDDSIIQLEKKYEQLQKEYQQITQERTKDLQQLKRETFFNQQTINQQNQRITQLRQQIQLKKNPIQSNHDENYRKYCQLLNNFFENEMKVSLYTHWEQIDMNWFVNFDFSHMIMIFETDENKVFGIVNGWYFIVIENDYIEYIYGPNESLLNIITPEHLQNKFICFNKEIFLTHNALVLRNIENVVENNYSQRIRYMLTNKPKQNEVMLSIKRFYFYNTMIMNK